MVEGSLFIGGLSFVNASTMLPGMLQDLGAPSWVIAFIPCLMLAGLMLPPFFTAHWVDRLERFKPLNVATGFFQRLPYLLAALVLLFCDPGARFWPVLALAGAPFLSGLACGISMTAWQQLVGKTVPARRRASLMALRLLFGSLLGVAAGVTAKALLERVPGVHGYGLLCLCTFGLMMLSYAFFTCLREDRAKPAMTGAGDMEESLRGAWALLAGHAEMRRYLGILLAAGTIGIITPFLAIHARGVLHKPEGYYGDLLVVQMAGALLGNLAAGWAGDRHGPRRVMMVSQVLFLAVAGLAAFGSTDFAFRLLFGVFGFAISANQVAQMTLTLEVCPAHRRSVSLALVGLTQLTAGMTASFIGFLTWGGPGKIGLAAGIATIGSALAFLGLLRLRETRHPHPQPELPAAS